MYDRQNDRGLNLRSVFGLIFDPQTYKSLLYLAMSFPLGLGYFLFLIIGFSLGAGLAVIGIGIPILVAVLFGSVALIAFERRLANALLDADIPEGEYPVPPGASVLRRLQVRVLNASTVKGIIYLFARFPFGIGALVMSVLSIALPLALITAPLMYRTQDVNIELMGNRHIDTFPEAIFAALVGIALLPVMLFLTRLMVDVWRSFTVEMLSDPALGGEYGKRKRVETPYYDKPKRERLEYHDEAYEDIEEQPRRTLAELVEEALRDENSRPS